jgi:hypothetical protein
MGIATLPGLCQWIVAEKVYERLDEAQQRTAVEKVATADPRPSDETYAAAKSGFQGLALEYAAMEDIRSRQSRRRWR